MHGQAYRKGDEKDMTHDHDQREGQKQRGRKTRKLPGASSQRGGLNIVYCNVEPAIVTVSHVNEPSQMGSLFLA